jgi:hypothetical protein
VARAWRESWGGAGRPGGRAGAALALVAGAVSRECGRRGWWLGGASARMARRWGRGGRIRRWRRGMGGGGGDARAVEVGE